ncbi:MAG: histidine phosphatase family protein [Chitinophagaceae bacterium]|nr:histidine phosphatase family protein [Chitinophagaceae bacterium]MBK7677857.1 histidine phosphatase family protein [Chitinophagaceae bacterium]MBK8300337.1 histidine phosphatase family protein [Chitinophagaceae bacterium]MBK9464376.1 histidine phosphatase family protein [Chitinophagaceae bacterium]MBK9658498.1 histidine phosphatase family protein [Chitinophagaceae bacterium]
MKTLILVRHAKSDWGNPGLDDFDRPLNERGKKDAPVMAQRLRDKKVKIDAFIASPAKRAAKTAKFFAEAYNKKKDDIEFKEKLYLAEPTTFFSIIATANDKHDSLAIFSHNYGITDFANMLTPTRIDNIPTAGVFAVKADCEKWADFKAAQKEFWFFDYPKAGVKD